MLDIVIIICCVTTGFALGKFVEKKSSDKNAFYVDLQRYISSLKDNVCGRQLETSAFNERFCLSCSDVFADYLLKGKLRCGLSKLQKNNIAEFFGHLDCVSSGELLSHIERYSKIISDDYKNVYESVAKSTVYAKLGMLLGAMVGILLV